MAEKCKFENEISHASEGILQTCYMEKVGLNCSKSCEISKIFKSLTFIAFYEVDLETLLGIMCTGRHSN